MKKILLPVVAVLVVIVGGIAWWWSMNNETADINSISTNKEQNEDVVKKDVTPISEVQTNNETTLNMSGRGLTKVTADVFTKTALTELNLSDNKLSGALPAEVRFLKNLKVLNLSNNEFTGVPAEIGQLEFLEVLDLSNNKITGLPNELRNLSNLKLLIISGNAYSETDLANIKKNLPATTVVKVN